MTLYVYTCTCATAYVAAYKRRPRTPQICHACNEPRREATVKLAGPVGVAWR